MEIGRQYFDAPGRFLSHCGAREHRETAKPPANWETGGFALSPLDSALQAPILETHRRATDSRHPDFDLNQAAHERGRPQGAGPRHLSDLPPSYDWRGRRRSFSLSDVLRAANSPLSCAFRKSKRSLNR
jgi:hypothetical protein